MTNPFRLDRTVEPSHYTIRIAPDLAAFTFTGEELIRLRARRRVRRITLHADELVITRAALYLGAARSAAAVRPRRITYDKTLETATLHFSRPVPAGRELLLGLAFTGTINDKMRGFYRTSYDLRGVKRWGGATQFEATDARRAFPCWDDPDRKAVFELTLRVPARLTALSNMPVARQRRDGGVKEITYQPTPRMSTYLLAWVIADLECVAARGARGTPIRVWTTVGKKHQGRFALQVGRRSLAYFAKWFGIPYALPKLDMVALPDFAAGAMENWGLVTYRETTLLVDPVHSSAPARQRVAEVISHELAHQWFGNLVTMAWWTDLWLNEGFASYMDPKAVNHQFPAWRVWSQFVAGEYLLALHDDGLRSSHPIEIPVQNPHEIREIFDHITYNKGSAVNRMLEHFLTEPVFRRGLSRYLRRYAFKNARTQDLWAALERVSGKPVRMIMANFTRQAGYPVVTVAPARRGLLRLTQRRFLSDGGRDFGRTRWAVPLVAAAQGSRRPSYGLLRGARGTLRIRTDGWVKLNAGHSGFYRTAYAPELFARLTRAVARGALPAIDGLGLLDDTFALARAGLMRTTQALELAVSAAPRYDDYNVWAVISGLLGGVEHILEEPWRTRLLAVSRRLTAPLASRIGWEPAPREGHLDALLRALLIARMGHSRDPGTIAGARARFARFLKTGQLAPDLRGPVYAIVAEHGGGAEFHRLLAVYRRSPLSEERVRILRGLTQFRRADLIRKTLAFALTDAVRKQDAYVILGGFGHNPDGRDLAWAFAKRHWKTLVSRYSNGGLRMMTYIIEGAAGGFTTDAALKDVRAFFKTHPVPGTARAMRQALEIVGTTIRWAKREGPDLRRWLLAQAP